MSYNILEAPQSSVVSVEEMKVHLRVDQAGEDSLIAMMISAAERSAEMLTGQSFITRTIEYDIYDFNEIGWSIRLPAAPVQSITSITYYKLTEETLAPEYYKLVDRMENPTVRPTDRSQWPCVFDTDPVTVTFKAGMSDDAADIPADIKIAIMQIAAAFYEFREQVNVSAVHEVPYSAQELLAPHRLWRF